MNQKTLLGIIYLVMMVALAKAQAVTGTVHDENDKVMPFVNVVAYSESGQTMCGVVTDAKGQFALDTVCHYMEFSFVGYETKRIDHPSGDLGVVSLVPSSKMLQQVEITAKRPEIINLPDRLEVKVANSVLASTADGMDMIASLPGVLSDGLSTITVIGCGSPIVYIDKKRVYDLTEVKNLKPEDVKSVEIVDMPSSRYGADVNSVIIIHTTKRNEFYSVDLSATLHQSRHLSPNGEVGVTLAGKKLAAYVYYKGGFDDSEHLSDIGFNNGVSGEFTQNEVSKDRSGFHNVMLSLQYDISSKQSIGFRTFNMFSNGKNDIVQKNFVDHNPDFNSDINGAYQSVKSSNTLFYNYQFGKNHDIEVTFDYFHGLSKSEAQYESHYFTPIVIDTTANARRSNNDVIVGEVNYNLPIGEKVSTEIGVRYSKIFTRSNSEHYFPSIIDDTLRQKYNSDEQTIAAFVSAQWKVSSKLSLRAGVRGEYTHRANQYNGKPYLDFKQMEFFPNFTLSYRPAKGYNIGLSYSRRVTRPTLSSLNPSQNIDPTSISYGQPDLKNEKLNSITLSIGLPKSIGIRMSYQIAQDPIINTLFIADSANVINSTYFNGDNLQSVSALAYWNYSPVKWLNIMTQFQYSQYFFTLQKDGNTIVNKVPLFAPNIGLTFTLPKKFTIRTGYSYNSSYSERNEIYGSYHSCYLILRKTFFEDKLALKLTINDPFNTSVVRQQWLTHGDYVGRFDMEWRQFVLNVTFRFGGSRKSVMVRSKTGEEESRMD